MSSAAFIVTDSKLTKTTRSEAVLDNETIIKAVECSDLGSLLLRPMINIIINLLKSPSSWLEGIWISNKSASLGTFIISNSVGWFGIKDGLISQYVLHSINYSKNDELMINAKWKTLNKVSQHGTVTFFPATDVQLNHNINKINIAFNFQSDNDETESEQKQIIGTAKRLISLKKEVDDFYLEQEDENNQNTDDMNDKYKKEWVESYKLNKSLLECTPYECSKYIFDNSLNIPIFGYGTLGDRECDGNNSSWNAPLIHGCQGKNAYIKGWKLYQHPTQHFPFANNKGNDCSDYKLIGRLLQWNDVYINAFKIYQIDQICGYRRDNVDSSFFKRKRTVCSVVDDEDGTETEVECWLWYVDKYNVQKLEKEFDLIQSGDWKDRKYSKYIPKQGTNDNETD